MIEQFNNMNEQNLNFELSQASNPCAFDCVCGNIDTDLVIFAMMYWYVVFFRNEYIVALIVDKV